MNTNDPLGKGNRQFSVSHEFELIPRWSVALSAAVFVFVQYLCWVVLPAHRHHPGPPLGMRVYFALSWSALAALYVLMIGYVSRDAPRRNMVARLWILVCLIMPGGVGAVLYFLLRQPVASNCPACGTGVLSDYHYCPQCACQISAACGACHRSVRVTDLYCTNCGHDLATDNTPERLKAIHSS